MRIVYSPMEALKIARQNPHRQVVFFGIGFETTAPANAMAVWQAHREGLRNFSMLVSHVLVPPAIRLLLGLRAQSRAGIHRTRPRLHRDGLREYEDLAREFHVPIVVGGFEPVDLLEAILMLVAQLEDGRAEVENQYARSVSRDGNLPAQRFMEKVFEVVRPQVARHRHHPAERLPLRPEFAAHDAEQVFGFSQHGVEEPPECISAEVLQGLKKPPDCTAFGTRCTPENPLGAPMVSSEGACAAYYHYRRHAL